MGGDLGWGEAGGEAGFQTMVRKFRWSVQGKAERLSIKI
jgi:hypothetical protein